MPMHFDEARRARLEAARSVDRSFTIGGERFERRAKVHPEALLPLDQMRVPKFADPTPAEAEAARAEGREPRGAMLDPGSTRGEDLAIIDVVVLAHIDTVSDPTAEPRYLALRARKDDPLDFGDLYELMRWLTQGETGRPTGRPGGSPPGPTGTETSSTGDSSSQDTQTG